MEELERIAFLDIETVTAAPSFDELSDIWKYLWEKKMSRSKEDPDVDPADSYAEKAALHAEFSKIIAISIGYIKVNTGVPEMRVKNLSGHNEGVLLTEFVTLLQQLRRPALCAHNLKGFDLPFICKRIMANNFNIPASLDVSGKKPWEIPHIDTAELWKFGSFSYTSLEIITNLLGIPTPKGDIDGSMVGHVYYVENDLPKISSYCGRDTVACAQVYLRMKGYDIIKEENITVV